MEKICQNEAIQKWHKNSTVSSTAAVLAEGA